MLTRKAGPMASHRFRKNSDSFRCIHIRQFLLGIVIPDDLVGVGLDQFFKDRMGRVIRYGWQQKQSRYHSHVKRHGTGE